MMRILFFVKEVVIVSCKSVCWFCGPDGCMRADDEKKLDSADDGAMVHASHREVQSGECIDCGSRGVDLEQHCRSVQVPG